MESRDIILLAIGLIAGTLGGMLGIGGSVIMVPAMAWFFGPAQQLYQGAAMIVNCFVAVPSVIRHHRAGAILRTVVCVTIPTSVVGVFLGVYLGSGDWFRGSNERYLQALFGAFLLYEAGYNVRRLLSAKRLPEIDEEAARKIPRWRIALGVGLPSGLVGGLLGIGGGAIAVPAQQAFLKMPLRRAIANSAATIVLLSFLGSIYKNYANAQAGIPLSASLRLAGLMAPSAMLGGFIGAGLAHTVPRGVLRVAVILIMTYFGGFLVYQALAR